MNAHIKNEKKLMSWNVLGAKKGLLGSNLPLDKNALIIRKTPSDKNNEPVIRCDIGRFLEYNNT